MTWQDDVRAFHEKTGGTVGSVPAIRDAALRAKLIAEEAQETIAALGFDSDFLVWSPGSTVQDTLYYGEMNARPSLAGVVDGVIDLTYVGLGTLVSAGVDAQPFWDEVHRANMAKADGPKREDGKQLKPEGWTPPDIEGLLERQQFAAQGWS